VLAPATFFHEHKRKKKVAKKPFFRFEFDFLITFAVIKKNSNGVLGKQINCIFVPAQ